MLKWFVKKINNRKGFTLVELIVVISILGILAAIAVPRFTNQTARAKESADKATARTIASAVTMAIANNTGATNPDATAINSNLTGITVTVVTEEPTTEGESWSVLYEASGSNFTVYKGKDKMYPASTP